ncbi:MAG: type IV pilin N-terminal domain-containing protein [Candidatus Aenigmarchaeota archaeon]|nr:type IV pilin N-terminal domain-containing protein [Candidatus Aenigmarchaeota archaeon]
MTYITSKQQKMTSRRAVAPIIATLLLVAIAVVGGSIIFVFSQGFFSAAQVSGSPNIESLKFTGYDASDGTLLSLHDGGNSTSGANLAGDGLNSGERIAVYVQNNSVQKITLNELRFGGAVYSFASGATDTILTTDGSFMIATKSNPGAAATTVAATSAEIQPGQQATVILQLSDDIKAGRDVQVKMTTGNGAVFVGTIIAGQQSG